jgi:hypothetical protein
MLSNNYIALCLFLLHAVFSNEYNNCSIFIAHKETSLPNEVDDRRPIDRYGSCYPSGIVIFFTELRIVPDCPPVARNLLSTGQSFYFNSQGVMTANRNISLFLCFFVFRDNGDWPVSVLASTINILEENYE